MGRGRQDLIGCREYRVTLLAVQWEVNRRDYKHVIGPGHNYIPTSGKKNLFSMEDVRCEVISPITTRKNIKP